MARALAGRTIFDVGYGAMNLSWGDRPSREDAIAVLRAAIESGIEHVDTADVYAPDAASIGHNEELVRASGINALIATKGGVRREADRWFHDGRPTYLRAACEASLRRLGRESIDLYYLHAVDEHVPIEESVGALFDLARQGKIRHVGVSNVDAGQLARALREAPIAAVQNELNVFCVDRFDRRVLEACEAHGIAFVAHSPIGGWRAGELAHLPALRAIADELGHSPFSIVLGWLLSRSPVIVPIAGGSKIASVRASAQAAPLRIDPSVVARVEAAYRI